MALDEDLRTEIIASSTTLGSRVHQNMVPQQQATAYPRCVYFRDSRVDELDLDGTRGELSESLYSVECISLAVNNDHNTAIQEATAAADAIRTNLNGKRGTFGAMTVKGTFVDDQDDDYIPRGTGEDAGEHVSALLIRIFST